MELLQKGQTFEEEKKRLQDKISELQHERDFYYSIWQEAIEKRKHHEISHKNVQNSLEETMKDLKKNLGASQRKETLLNNESVKLKTSLSQKEEEVTLLSAQLESCNKNLHCQLESESAKAVETMNEKLKEAQNIISMRESEIHDINMKLEERIAECRLLKIEMEKFTKYLKEALGTAKEKEELRTTKPHLTGSGEEIGAAPPESSCLDLMNQLTEKPVPVVIYQKDTGCIYHYSIFLKTFLSDLNDQQVQQEQKKKDICSGGLNLAGYSLYMIGRSVGAQVINTLDDLAPLLEADPGILRDITFHVIHQDEKETMLDKLLNKNQDSKGH